MASFLCCSSTCDVAACSNLLSIFLHSFRPFRLFVLLASVYYRLSVAETIPAPIAYAVIEHLFHRPVSMAVSVASEDVAGQVCIGLSFKPTS